ncbi:MAG: InlB B-repeat-containing protein, partial [Acholeplasmatales bacterium]|nr:InlB B-repeat-containing protein [Acholeplasmatales bacterium]
TFNYNNGDAATTQTLAYGSKVTKPSDPAKAEDNDYTYTFAGWYTTSDFQEGTEFDFNKDTVTGATALYAKYTPVAIVRYEVTFDMDGGSVVSAQTVREGYTATEPDTEPTKAHDDTYKYTFAGWYADADRTQAFDFGSPITKATTVYAKWTANLLTKYTVTFDSVGGTDVAAQNIVEDETATKPTNPTKEADIENTYAFAGWYTTSDYQGTEFDFTNTPITEATTLYAKWTATPITYMAIAINTDNVTKEYEIGDTIDLTGLVVEGKHKGGTVTLTEEYYTVTVTDPSGNAFNIENATEADGTYTITIQKTGTTSTSLKKTFTVVVKKEQYKFNFDFTATSYNESLETPYTEDYQYPAATYTLFDNKSLKIELTATGGDQVKFQKYTDTTDTSKTTVDGTFTLYDRFQIHASYGYISVTAKKSGKITVYCAVGSNDGRKVIIKNETDNDVEIEGATTWDSTKLYALEFDAIEGKTYTIRSSSKGALVYGIYFAGSIDKDTRVATDEFEFVPEVTQFDTIDNIFDTTNIAGTASAWDNCGVYRSVALSDITFTVKDSTDTAVTSPITTPGAYTVTATYDGKSVDYNIVVADPNAPITQVIVNSDNATKKFYEGEAAFNANNIVVQGVRDGITVALNAEDYTIKLYKADTEVTAFDTTGEYTVRVYANDTDVYGSYTINFYQITSTNITSGDTATVKVGTTSFKSCATAELVYADNTRKDITKNIVEKYYTESTCENETTTPFAAAGTVYLQLSVNGATKVITITVAELTANEYTYDRESDNYGISKEGAETPWTTDSYKDGKIATFDVNSDGVKLIKLLPDASMTLTLDEASNMIDISLTGRTSGSNSASKYLKIEFLDADGEVIDTVIGTTTANKEIGAFTFEAYDNATSFTFTATTACAAIRFSGTTSSKSVGIATATITAYTA